jgi:hypothetical protein
MWPCGGSDSNKGSVGAVSTPTPSPPQKLGKDGLPKPEKLPKGLQDLVDEADRDESFYDELWGGK